MSEWQRSQACDCIKYFAGIFLPSRVCAELGKNFPLGPSPSPSMVSVGMYGLTTRLEFFHAMLRAHHEPAAIPLINSASTEKLAAAPAKPLPNHPRLTTHEVATNKTPTAQSAICRKSQTRKRFGVPILISAIPNNAPIAISPQPKRISRGQSRKT